MTSVERYLAEEVALDYADGLLTRGEALRRLALMGMSTATATTLLSTAKATAAPAPAPSRPAHAPPPGGPVTQPIRFAGPDGRELQGAWAPAEDPEGAVLLIHENRGLTDHIRSVAARLADDGYSALAIDLLSEEGGTAALGGDAEAMAALSKVPPERFVADMKAGVAELERRVDDEGLAAVGFCFGGGMVWRLLAAGERRLAAAVPFYGPLPDAADFSGSRAAVLGIYAELDARVNASRDPARAALEKAGLEHEIVTFAGVNHAFFNDTGPRYDQKAARKAYRRVLRWFARHLD